MYRNECSVCSMTLAMDIDDCTRNDRSSSHGEAVIYFSLGSNVLLVPSPVSELIEQVKGLRSLAVHERMGELLSLASVAGASY